MLATESPRDRYTFAGNLRQSRHGWLRLTPAYSVHVVRELLEQRPRPDLPVLDPFCGTGTTQLTCAEQGVACDTVDVNPFLLWLTRAKLGRYGPKSLAGAEQLSQAMVRAALGRGSGWAPPMHHIERWWDEPTLAALSRAYQALARARVHRGARDLAALAFCQALIKSSSASFGHQSMSFAQRESLAPAVQRRAVADTLTRAIEGILPAAREALSRAPRRILHGDARALSGPLSGVRYGMVITSPPYANRMSYIRELRPYMYWLGYLEDQKSAGELDWRAIGGTWGAATSRLSSWDAPARESAPGLKRITGRIARQSDVLARYVEKYFADMAEHLSSLRRHVARGGVVHYVVGNSKFYDVELPVQDLLAAQLERAGFKSPEVVTLRKRTSKRELFEYRVSARG